ncbi:hypothetical protein ACP70R_043921 [Stipagrostis hirtigluma subsp. patula]
MFEHDGLICRHIIKVLVHLGAKKLPEKLIMSRWTRTIDPNMTMVPYVKHADDDNIDPLRRSVQMTAIGLLNAANEAPGALDIIMKHLQAANVDIRNKLKTENDHTLEDGHVDLNGHKFKDPLRVRSKGRPAHKRIKSWSDKKKMKQLAIKQLQHL